jgi:DNA-binding response OmpR family regulator
MKILVVEDDEQVSGLLERCLTNAGYAVDLAEDGETAVRLAEAREYGAVILDLMLPVRNGLQVAEDLRRDGRSTPIIMLTGCDTTEEMVRGLDAGADDYVTKPFKIQELLARVRAVARRQAAAPSTSLTFGPLELDLITHRLDVDGHPLDLTQREYILVELLMQSPGDVVSRAELREKVCGMESGSDSNAVDVHVGNLRRKLRKAGYGAIIRTARGIGFSLDPQWQSGNANNDQVADHPAMA